MRETDKGVVCEVEGHTKSRYLQHHITAVNLHAQVLESTQIWAAAPPFHVGKGVILTSYLPEGEDEGIYNKVLKLVDATLP